MNIDVSLVSVPSSDGRLPAREMLRMLMRVHEAGVVMHVRYAEVSFNLSAAVLPTKSSIIMSGTIIAQEVLMELAGLTSCLQQVAWGGG
mmetsp:Transcript_7030/g.13168  ORF Transcript_7030/g.13168 Transcript_7030/m.13168 type:complete len:89 (+) Transcript_7030:1078-1344(+)|eukprot:CAMPEP_0114275420 /NCGR_PEP_ID=MMETSP0058-20121206/30321_1 /TAXON_ID=36894 /ORGANISM="Pyramimonas parkeae, CCMP726" /LENGTH=88 /DNA_ID=CAMNT_0001395341 /DNA_START=1669 /DNA_END=1935 /DNA_ORIENTATION=+